MIRVLPVSASPPACVAAAASELGASEAAHKAWSSGVLTWCGLMVCWVECGAGWALLCVVVLWQFGVWKIWGKCIVWSIIVICRGFGC